MAMAVGVPEATATATAWLAAAQATWSSPRYVSTSAWLAVAMARPARSPGAASAATPR